MRPKEFLANHPKSVYCGKIFISKYKDEEAHLVKGSHEPLISESLFDEVMDVLDGRKKVTKTKISSPDELPLRGYLICPKCGYMLTCSASKGCRRQLNDYSAKVSRARDLLLIGDLEADYDLSFEI